jgi:hypothetical protein
MKCPKCGYLGFEDVRRCRNCGYDFSLTSAPSLPDLPIRTADATPRPLEDLEFVDAAAAPQPPRMTDAAADLDRLIGVPDLNTAAPDDTRPRATRPGVAASAASSPGELPLFGPAHDDQPLITKASPPRAPLAVRRSTPDVPRMRAT